MGLLSKLFKKIIGNSTDVQQNCRKEDKQNSITLDVNAKIEVEVEIKKNTPEIPPLQGEYAKTIFLYANSYPSPVKCADDYQRYLIYECGIRDPSVYHSKLIEEGYFELTSTTEFLNGLKLPDLKAILSENGLQVTGKKEILIRRIVENLDDEMIKKYSTKVLYSVSDKGKELLEKHKDYIEVHRHKNWGIDWQEYDANKKAGFSFYDVVWGILNKRILESRNFGRSEYLNMYQLLEEKGDRRCAIAMLLRVLYIDFAGTRMLENLEIFKNDSDVVERMKGYFNITMIIAPGLVKSVYEYADVYEDEMIEELYQWKLPVQVCSKEMFLSIIHSIMDETYDEEKTLEILKVAYDKTVESLCK